MAIHPRNERYKKKVLAAPYALCLERARYFTESYRRTEGEHHPREEVLTQEERRVVLCQNEDRDHCCASEFGPLRAPRSGQPTLARSSRLRKPQETLRLPRGGYWQSGSK